LVSRLRVGQHGAMVSDADASGDPVTTEHLTPDAISASEGGPEPDAGEQPEPDQEAVSQPGKVMRVGSMIKQLLDEVRQADLDDESRVRLREVYQQAVSEVSEALSPDLQEELGRFSLPFLDGDRIPSDAELRVAQAQLVGWLEGLFTGIQATLFAQQMAARQQLEQMRGQLPPGAGPAPGNRPPPADRPGTYL
jgi:hypothetical protein